MKRDTRIVMLLPDLRIGGAQRVFLMLAREFSAMGLRVDIFLLAADGALRDELPEGIRLLQPNSAGGGRLLVAITGFWRFLRYLHRYRPSAVLSTMTGTNLLAIMARAVSRRMTTRMVIREAASLRNLDGRWLMRRLVAWAYPSADCVVAVSQGVAKELVGLGVPKSKLVAIPNPVDRERLRMLAAKARADGPMLDTRYLISVGRLIRQKNHALLLDAFARSESRLSHRLVIVGEGPLRPALEEQAARLGVRDRVDFMGASGNPYGLLAGSDALVLSSRWEGHPNVLLEALAMGVPAIATDCPHGPREVLHSCAGGTLVPVGDSWSLARAIDRVIHRGLDGPVGPGPSHEPGAVARRYAACLGVEVPGA